MSTTYLSTSVEDARLNAAQYDFVTRTEEKIVIEVQEIAQGYYRVFTPMYHQLGEFLNTSFPLYDFKIDTETFLKDKERAYLLLCEDSRKTVENLVNEYLVINEKELSIYTQDALALMKRKAWIETREEQLFIEVQKKLNPALPF